MRRDYALEPKVQHYACMIDILGRAGQLEEALNLIRSMPIEANDVVWRSLLSACRNHRNVGMGRKLMKGLTQGGAWDSSTCVLLSNLYAGVGMWGDARKVRTMMREKELKKVPGCSWIELDGIVHEFVVGDYLCPRAKEASSSSEMFCTSNLHSSTTSLEYTCS
ncbi:Pentatricopeptide repeat-containing protein [Musa troglodytarum]|nr:Pentatricopeptide repeat-containing protein [Musa troglodytarum]